MRTVSIKRNYVFNIYGVICSSMQSLLSPVALLTSFNNLFFNYHQKVFLLLMAKIIKEHKNTWEFGH